MCRCDVREGRQMCEQMETDYNSCVALHVARLHLLDGDKVGSFVLYVV